MRHLLTASALLAISIVAMGAILRHTGEIAEARPKSSPSASPVVVELFTSEGCSSCPPADALLIRMAARQWPENEKIISLEEHVDYWDQLGWRDPFSSRQWTERQESYAVELGNGSVYTPQMVMDGRTEFVGSREAEAKRVIEELAGKAKTEVSVAPAKSSDDNVRFAVRVGKLVGENADDTSEVWLAITESGLHSVVTRGENAGEDLHHAAVVRTLRKLGVANARDPETSFSGEVKVSFDRGWKRDNLRAVVFVQEKKNRRIVGAAETKVTP
ncbi:MAG TPA: DUF1223 domain-containing protein [Candidatus Acidoferrum sp.]|nr:DUF1223 domain-containing protein [Candidatus Acidoferrum sp.]